LCFSFFSWSCYLPELKKFDYIIAGTGAAGLQLAWFMSRDRWFDDKQILLIDRDEKISNDRTWCFWERGAGTWDAVLTQTWDQFFFSGEKFSKCYGMEDFRYKMIRSADFYRFVIDEIRQKQNFVLVKSTIQKISDEKNEVIVSTGNGDFCGSKVFSSIPAEGAIEKAKKDLWLSQHFKGWFVKSAKPMFDEKVVVMMDYSVEQRGNTRFMYMLPISAHEALVEYTLFSSDLLQEKEYDDEIKKYLECMGCTDYQIVETETGQIPMTTYPFWESNSANILHIGTAGGWTKASSGYTFYFTQKKSKALCEFLKTAKDISRFQRTNRFRFYDLVMLDLLVRRNDLGKQFFTSVYKNQPVGRVFDFLNEESSLLDEARIIFSSRPRKELIRSVSRVFRYWLGF
jgi:lycopene beta-cyclase